MDLLVVLAIIELFLTFVLTVLILLIMLRQPSSPNLRVRFKNGRKLIKCNRGKDVIISFYVENVGHLFAKPAAIGVSGWVNFPSGFKPKEIRTLGTQGNVVGLSRVYRDEGTMSVRFPRSHHLFYKEKWHFDIDVEIPQERNNYALFIPVLHERGNCDTSVLKVKVV